MTESKKNFYFQGKWFETDDEMFSYIQEWKKMSLDEETAERTLQRLKNDIWMNIFLRGNQYTNEEFSLYVEKIFNFAIQEMQKKGE